MDISGLVKPISEQTDEELLERIRALRHRRETVRPAMQAHKAKPKKDKAKKETRNVDKLVMSLSDAQRAALIAQLELGE